jgi:hypothetical protein
MNARLEETTSQADPVVRGIAVVTVAITIVGMLALVRAAVGRRVDHLTVRVDNRAGLAVQVDALDASGDRVGLGEAEAKALTSTALAAANWTVTIPTTATSALERARFQ